MMCIKCIVNVCLFLLAGISTCWHWTEVENTLPVVNSEAACVLDFLSGDLDVGSKMTIYHDDIPAYILCLDQIFMQCNIPRLGQLVGV